ncbi:MAG: chromate transporter [Clostridia bacterium]|nr:chromate transporter [Clostridia bacterium]MBR6784323.1 chromate transporter [Clostridia bacterium]
MIYLKIFLTFLKIGAFTFGGGYAMLPLMQQEVLNNGWMSEEQLLNFIAVAESTPGPVAINMATYIGVETGGILGAIIATLGVVLPSFVVILIVARFYAKYKNSFIVKSCLTGLRPVVVGLIASAVVSLGFGVFFPSGATLAAFDFGFVSSVVIFGLVVYLAFKKVNPIYLILGSAGMGIVSGYAEKLFF